MKSAGLVMAGLILACGSALAADAYPDIVQVQPAAAMAGQTIRNFRIVGTHFENFQKVTFRTASAQDNEIKVTKVVKKNPSYVVVEVEIPKNARGKRIVVVRTKVGGSVSTLTADNTFEILPYVEKKADLRISSITWGTSFNPDGNYVRVYVQNAGGTAAKGFKVDLYRDGVKKLAYNYAPTLPAGSTVGFETGAFTLPRTKADYKVKAVADATGVIPETNESNNTRERVLSQPADEFTVPDSGYLTNSLVKDKTAPNFTLKDYRSKPWTLYDYRGKPMLIVLGAMWSSYMQIETAALKGIQADYGPKGLVIAQIFYDDTDGSGTTLKDPPPELLKAWVDVNQVTFSVLGDTFEKDSYHSAYGRYLAVYQPMNYIVKADGTVQALIQGFYESAIRDAVKAVTGG